MKDETFDSFVAFGMGHNPCRYTGMGTYVIYLPHGNPADRSDGFQCATIRV